MKVDADFLEDLRRLLLIWLDDEGISVPTDVACDVTKVAQFFHHYVARLIEPVPRRVRRSHALDSRTLDDGIVAAIAEIERRAVAGEDLRPFLHRKLGRQPARNDGMLNEWGIHHLHLGGTAPAADGHVPSRDEILCVLVRPTDLYLIDVHTHRDWSNDRLVQIVHDEWPEVLAPFILRGIEVRAPITKTERQVLRAKNAMAVTRVSDGTCYAAIGGGYAASGVSVNAVIQADMLVERVRALEADVRANANACADGIARARGARPSQLRFALEFDEHGAPSAVETVSRVRITLTASAAEA